MSETLSTYHVIGLMSGTSLDGLDLVCCSFTLVNGKWDFQVIAMEEFSWEEEWVRLLSQAFYQKEEDIKSLDLKFGKLLAEKTRAFIIKNQLNPLLISSHGHTIFHKPEQGITLQIGNGQQIADKTGVITINNFRIADVKKGGQGAPLVPVGDRLLFAKYDFCLNIGGISNISFELKGKRIAFDISPANMVLNYLVGQKGLKYDSGGRMASAGKVNQDLLDQLNSLDYYQLPYPKSLGREWVEAKFIPVLDQSDLSIEDKLATCCMHIAGQVADVINEFLEGNLLITGGGAFNNYLIKRIKELSNHKVIIPSKEIIQMKEAIVFAFLGLLRYLGEINCLCSVTGASSDSSTGDIYHPSFEKKSY